MIKQLTLTNQTVVRTGVNTKGEDWTLYGYEADGKKYTSFNDFERWLGKEMAYEVEQREGKINPKTNKPYINWSITGMATMDKQPAGKETNEAPKISASVRFDAIDEKLEMIFLMLGDFKTMYENDKTLKQPF